MIIIINIRNIIKYKEHFKNILAILLPFYIYN